MYPIFGDENVEQNLTKIYHATDDLCKMKYPSLVDNVVFIHKFMVSRCKIFLKIKRAYSKMNAVFFISE